MAGGLFLGVFWGIIVSLVVAAAVSLNTPMPQRPGAPAAIVSEQASPPPEPSAQDAASAPETAPAEESPAPPEEAPAEAAPEPSREAPADTIPLPAGSEFNRPPAEEEAVLPATDEAPGVTAPASPPLPLDTFSGGIDTAPAPQPAIAAAPSALQQVQPDAGTSAIQPTDGTVLPVPPLRPETGPAPVPQPSRDTAANPDATTAPAPVGEPEMAAAADVAEGLVETPETEPEAAQVEQVAAAEAEPSPPAAAANVVNLVPPRETEGVQSDLPEVAAAPDTAPGMPQTPPRVLRQGVEEAAPATRTLPQVVVPGRVETPPEPSEAPVPETLGDLASDIAEEFGAEDDTPALVAYAAEFDAAEERPLMAVVLIDVADERLELSTLTDFSFPVAFAIDPTRSDATERAAAYRAAGFEVLLLASAIPPGATAADTEVALAAARRLVPEAVALIDTPDSRLQSDRVVLEAAVATLAEQGQGLVAFPRGLNTAEQMAARVDVPAATLFRVLDDEDERATVITRLLGRAEFAAGQEGGVIVVGRTRPDTVTALYSWALGNRNAGVAIAPVSAVLLRLAEEE